MAAGAVPALVLRDAMLRTAPQDEGSENCALHLARAGRPLAAVDLAVGVLRLDAKRCRTVRPEVEAEVGILGDRYPALHAEQQRVALPDLELIDEVGRNVEQRDLIALQPRIVRMADHDLRFARRTRRTVRGLGELAELHLPQR